jgi:prepilin-type N-terminal cleavage/methylation domain-containing protein
MKNNKGFTLIELLAVIVILAIIALIATPLIMNVIDDAKKGAFKNTAYGIVSASELKYAQGYFNEEEGELIFTYEDGVENSNVDGKKLEYKGTKPQNGTIVVNSKGQISVAIHDGKYCAQKTFDDSVVSIASKSEEECKIISSYMLSVNLRYGMTSASMSPSFQSDIFNYTTRWGVAPHLSPIVSSITLTPYLVDSTATIIVTVNSQNGVQALDGQPLIVPVSSGQNIVDIKVIASNGSSSTYSIIVNKG